jgi:hypothetical protein
MVRENIHSRIEDTIRVVTTQGSVVEGKEEGEIHLRHVAQPDPREAHREVNRTLSKISGN